MNLFKRRLAPDEVDELSQQLDKSDAFTYSIMEGGYVSKDRHVIFYVDRFPYSGMLMAYRPEGETEQERWVAYFTNEFNLTDI